MTGRAIWAGVAPQQPSPEDENWFWASGYAVAPDNRLLFDCDIGQYLAAHRVKLSEVAAQLNGCFTAIFHDGDKTRIVTDRFGTRPVYIGPGKNGRYMIADDPWRVIPHLSSEPKMDPLALIDLLHTGYVTGCRTLIAGFRTAAPAAITTLEGPKLRTQRYWAYGYSPDRMEEQDASAELADILSGVAKRTALLLQAKDARPVLTLSGGLDSRLLAGLFSREPDMPDMAAIAYGAQTDPEVQVASEVARALDCNFSTTPIDHSYFNPDFLARSVREVGLTTRFTCGTGARHLQVATGATFIPGHTGDFISGGHLPPHSGLVSTRAELIRFLDLRHFRYPFSDRLMRDVLTIDPESRFDSLTQTTSAFDTTQDMFGLIDRWNVENRQRRLILMELRAYEGIAPWLLPFYDYALVDFFARIPHELRIGQRLYIQTALQHVFSGETAMLGTIRRVGNPLRVNEKAFGRITSFSKIPASLRLPLLRAWPVARGAQAWMRQKPPNTSGPDPILHWMQNVPAVRSFFMDRLRSLNIREVDSDRLIQLIEADKVPEAFVHRFITSALTAQETLTAAERIWNQVEAPPAPGD